MLPISLVLEGVYSYRERQIIDFERLTKAKLFGIFGPVGSGKSTILEAIIFALYGKNERLNKDPQYNLINLQSNNLFIDFQFKAGEESTLFRAVVQCKRNKKNFKAISSTKFEYYKFTDEDWMPCTREEMVNTIGLSVNNFRRIIIIPQGKFQDFLLLGDTDRTNMMMEIFTELRQYEFSDNIKVLESNANDRMNIIKGELQGIGEVDENVLNDTQSKLENTLKEIVKVKTEIETLQAKEVQLKTAKTYSDELIIRQNEEEALLKDKSKYKDLKHRLEKYEYCSLNFKQDIARLENLNVSYDNASKELKEFELQLKFKRSELDLLIKQLHELKKDYDKKDELNKEIQILGKFSELKHKEEEYHNLKTRSKKGNDYINNLKSEISDDKEQIALLRKECQQILKSIPEPKTLSEIQKWHNHQIHLHDYIKRIENEIEVLQKDKLNLSEEFKNIISKYAQYLSFDGLKTSQEIMLHFKHFKDSIPEELNKLHEQEIALRTRKKLCDFSKELSTGDPCPLCGSLEHPNPLNEESNDKILNEISQEKKQKNKLLSYINELLLDLSEYQIREKFINDKELEFLRQLNLKKEEIAQHSDKFIWESLNIKDLSIQLEGFEKRNSEKTEKENLITKMEVKLDEKIKNYDRYFSEVEKINNDLLKKESEISYLQNECKDFRMLDNLSVKDVETLISEKKEKLINLELEFSKLTDLVQDKESKCKVLIGSIEVKNHEVKKVTKELETTNKSLEDKLQNTNYNTLDEVRSILNQSFDLLKERDLLNKYHNQLHAVESRVKELQHLIEKYPFNPDEYEIVTKTLVDLKSQESQFLTESGKLESQFKYLKDRLNRSINLIKELKELERRLLNLQLLKSLFRANDFVKFVSSIYLENLCNAANARFFKMTRQSLKLELNEDNDFVIRDFMNEGRIRSVRTLSGGQIFQASLSLALALTDNIKHLTGSDQNFFFLDEGFGSLDKESLGIVFETLKSLRNENRVVGLISHVEEMQQELTEYLFVENTTERGSVVKHEVL